MAKFSGTIGYGITKEVSPGVWEEVIEEKIVYGDIIRNTSRRENSSGLNDNIVLSNSFSFIADPYAKQNFQFIKFIKYLGQKWNVTNVEVEFPRLIVTTGGVYNEQ